MKMIWRIKNKIHGKNGETIGETLVALLISALALTMLAGAITAGSNMIKASRDKIATYYNEAEKMASLSDVSSSNVTISVTDGFSQTADVGLVANDTFKKMKVVAYKKVD